MVTHLPAGTIGARNYQIEQQAISHSQSDTFRDLQ